MTQKILIGIGSLCILPTILFLAARPFLPWSAVHVLEGQGVSYTTFDVVPKPPMYVALALGIVLIGVGVAKRTN